LACCWDWDYSGGFRARQLLRARHVFVLMESPSSDVVGLGSLKWRLSSTLTPDRSHSTIELRAEESHARNPSTLRLADQ
jgi:hypothetical protein